MTKVQARHKTKTKHAHKEPQAKLCARDKWVRMTSVVDRPSRPGTGARSYPVQLPVDGVHQCLSPKSSF